MNKFIKNESDGNECKNLLKTYFSIFNVLHKFFLGKSKKCIEQPQISNLVVISWMANELEQVFPDKIDKPSIELAFMRATSGDDAAKLGGQLCRGEFFEFMLRITNRIATADKDANQQTSEIRNAPYLLQIIKKQIIPAVKNCSLIKDRKLIHSSKFLNSLIHKNQLGLNILFEDAKIEGVYSFESADDQFNSLAPKGKHIIENLKE